MEINPALRDSLQLIAEGATELARFAVAAISVVSDGVLETVAVVGDAEAKAELMQLRTPVEAVLAELETAEVWGPLQFLPSERAGAHLEGYAWVPHLPAGDAPDAWQPDDLLVGLLRDGSGRLRGVLSMDMPVDGKRPGPEQRRILQMFARQAERAVVTALERGDYEADLIHERAIASYRRHLVDVLSHDLLNAIGAVANAAELLRLEGEVSGRVAEGLSIVDRGAAMVRDLVEDMKALTRLGDPAVQVQLEPVDLGDIVESVGGVYAAEARKRRVSLQVEVAGEQGPIIVRGERSNLTRMVSNLISNAIKYSDDDGRVEVLLRTGSNADPADPADRAQLTIADQGIGISVQDQKRLYDEFFRSSDSATRQRAGLGLGLAIVHRVLVQHDGTIDVASSPGEGTTFRVRLPLANSAEAPLPMPPFASH